jgi:hypothetical protein
MLTRICGELEQRLDALRPLVDEYHRLLVAADAIALVEVEVPASDARESDDGASPVPGPLDGTSQDGDPARNAPLGTNPTRTALSAPLRTNPTRTAPSGTRNVRAAGASSARTAPNGASNVRPAPDGTSGARDDASRTPPDDASRTPNAPRSASRTPDTSRSARLLPNTSDGSNRERYRRGSAAGTIALAASPRDAIEQAAYLAEAIDPSASAAPIAPASSPRKPKIPPPASVPRESAPRASPPRRSAPSASDQDAILAALEHGSHTPSELAMVTALSPPSVRTNLSRLLARGAVTRITREGKIAYALA